MVLWSVALAIVAGVLALVGGLWALSRMLQRREPYASFMRLRSRQKLRFFRLLVSDPRVPRRAKALPFLLAAYLVFPIDLIPDFIPVLGYLDDVALVLATLALVIRLTPRAVVDDLLRQLAESESS